MKLKKDRHEQFCQEYIIDFNGTRAATDAGFSKRTARSQAQRLLTNVDIQARIAELLKDRAERTQVTQDMVIRELALIAFSDLRNYITIDELTGAIQAKGFKAMPEGQSRVLRSIKEDRVIKEDADGKKTTVYDKVKFELWDKPRALELLGKHLAMFLEKFELTGKDGVPLFRMPRPGANSKPKNKKKAKFKHEPSKRS